MQEDEVDELIKTAKSASLFVGLAGKLSAESFKLALNFSPNFIGVRSAVCAAEVREGTISDKKITIVKNLLYKNNVTNI